MNFLIADSFTDSLARLTGDEQKAVKTTAFDLQLNPANPGMSFHKLDKAKDKNFWSVRVSSDIRVIVHKTVGSLLLCYVDHHDKAYDWAERRKLETHPKTGAAQLIEIRETVQEIAIPKYVEAKTTVETKPILFGKISEEELMGFGVPAEWINDVRNATEDTLLELADHLPREAAEALLNLATGAKPKITASATAIDPFKHPDAQRRFRLMGSAAELERALEYPWDKWTVFLHPEQKELVEKSYSGPVRISGSAGTGKTIVALHRAVFLAKTNPETRVLLTTFSDVLANALHARLRRLIGNEPRLGERLEVQTASALGLKLFERSFDKARIASREEIKNLLKESSEKSTGKKISPLILLQEWDDVDDWQLDTWESYRDRTRLGRKTRLSEERRAQFWAVFSEVKKVLKSKSLLTYSDIFTRLAASIRDAKNKPFDFVVVDEAQDIGVAELRFLAALGSGRPDGLFFSGDLGQRIFRTPFSWKDVGVDIRGRSYTLRVNYRTSHQIRSQADLLLESKTSDVDGNVQERQDTLSVFNGPSPEVRIFKSRDEEMGFIESWLTGLKSKNISPGEIGVFTRSDKEVARARSSVEKAGLPFTILDQNMQLNSTHVSIGTMHLAKGLEFRAVVVMACDDEVIPSQQRIETAAENTDLEEIYNSERYLLYVACTRTRDHLLVSGVEPASEFLGDLKAGIN